MWRTTPDLRSIMPGMKARSSRTAAIRLSCSISCQSSSVSTSNPPGLVSVPPTLLTRTSSPPQSCRIRSATEFKHAEPATSVLVASETAHGDGVREGEEALALASLLTELVHELRELEREHRFETLAADVALRRAVEAVAHRHVVGGDRLGDGSRRTPGGEERTDDFLPA